MLIRLPLFLPFNAAHDWISEIWVDFLTWAASLVLDLWQWHRIVLRPVLLRPDEAADQSSTRSARPRNPSQLSRRSIFQAVPCVSSSWSREQLFSPNSQCEELDQTTDARSFVYETAEPRNCNYNYNCQDCCVDHRCRALKSSSTECCNVQNRSTCSPNPHRINHIPVGRTEGMTLKQQNPPCRGAIEARYISNTESSTWQAILWPNTW